MNDKGEAWIVLSSTTGTKNLPPEESLYFADVLRDATILKRRFPALVSLTIETLNAAHEQIDWQTLFVRLEDFPQPLTLDVSPKISEDEVAQLIGSMISSFQLPIKNKRIGVVKDVVSQTESQIVTIELEVSDSTEANSFLTGLIYDLRARMQDFNPKTGANVGAYKIIVKDQENNVLVAYQWDLDFRREISNMVKGIEPWVSMPPPAK